MRSILVALLLFFFSAFAQADERQFTVGAGAAFASYSEVHVTDASNKEVFHGFADRLGRIHVSLPAGTYQFGVTTSQGRLIAKTIQLTGSDQLRTVALSLRLHLPSSYTLSEYLAEASWRLDRRFELAVMVPRLVVAAVRCPTWSETTMRNVPFWAS